MRSILMATLACGSLWVGLMNGELQAQTVKLPGRFVPGDAAVGAAANGQAAPFLERGGNLVLAVWADNRGNPIGGYEGETSKDIYGLRLDGSGTLLETVPFVIDARAGTQDRPRAAWNGTNWLVVYESVDFNGTGYYTASLEALRVSPAGQVLDAQPIKLFNMVPVGATWAVASDGAGWVVVNQSTSVNGDLVAARISAAGVLLDPGPKSLLQETFYLRGGLHLAYAGGVYLLAYEESMTGSDPTNLIRFDAALNRLDPAPLGLAGSPLRRMVSNGSGFYGVWTEQRPDFTIAVKGSRIGTNGQKLDGTGVDISGPNEPSAYTSISVAWDGTHWKATWGSASGTRLARISAAGQVLDPGGVLVSGANPGISASAGNGTLQLAWDEYTNSTTDVFTVHVNSSQTAGPVRSVSVGAPSQLKPDIALNASGSMIVYRSVTSARQRILAQPLDAAGNPLTAEPTELDNVDAAATLGAPNVAWNGSHYLVVWNNPSGVVARRVLPSGAAVEAAPFVVLSSAFGGTDVEALGGDFLVIGQRCGFTCQIIYPIGSRVRGSDGAVLDPSPIVFYGTYSSSPRLAVLGNRWIAAWQNNATHDDCMASTLSSFVSADGSKTGDVSVHGPYSSCGGNGAFSLGLAANDTVALMVQSQELTSGVETDVLGRLINPDGTVQPMINLTPWEGDQYNPRATWDGTRFVIAFQDQRLGLGGSWGLEQIDARSDLFGMRVSAAGAVLDPAGFVISNNPLGEAFPSVAARDGRTLFAASVMRSASPLANYRIGYDFFGTSTNQPPVVVAAANPRGGDVPLSVAFSSAGTGDLDGSVSGLLWDFGDGSTSTVANPTHVYTGPGPFIATLQATDDDGAQSLQAVLVLATAVNLSPVAAISSNLTHGPQPLDVSFSARGSYDPDGFVGNIHWDYGDGQEGWGGNAYHTYYDPGTYHVVVTVYDGRDGTGTATLDITVDSPLPPAAPANLSAIAFSEEWINMTWSDLSNNEAGFKVERCQGTTAFCAANPAAWGEIATVGANIDYYGDMGLPSQTTFSYRVRAFNVTAHSAYSNVSTATTKSAPPVASFAPSVLGGLAPLPVQFDGRASHDPDGSIVAWNWSFGDGSTGSGAMVSHTFASEGWYFVQLTVTDNSGATATSDQTITVKPGSTRTPASADAGTTFGTILSGSYLDTLSQNDVAEVLQEAQVGSTPSTRKSQLEHKWSLTVAAGNRQSFYLDAWHSTNSEGDDFVFEYSLDNATWTPMITVTKTVDDDNLQSYRFTQPLSGPLWIRVRDLDRTAGRGVRDRVNIDEMFISSSPASGVSGEAGRTGGLVPDAPLMVSKTAFGQLQLSWGASCVASDSDYAIYEGQIGAFGSHRPALCSTGGSTTGLITPTETNAYFLVVPSDTFLEGQYGTASNGSPIPAGATRCLPPAESIGCP